MVSDPPSSTGLLPEVARLAWSAAYRDRVRTPSVPSRRRTRLIASLIACTETASRGTCWFFATPGELAEISGVAVLDQDERSLSLGGHIDVSDNAELGVDPQ